jgi:hypothetical protein
MAISWSGARCDFLASGTPGIDTSTGGVHEDLLKQEVVDLALGSANPLSLSGAGTAYSLEFDAEPSTGDKTSVETAIGNHDHTAQAAQQILEHTDTVDPTPTDDASKGYVVNCRWINTLTNNVWFCTNNAANDAVWKSATSPSCKYIYAPDMLFPNNADWAVNAMAPLALDATDGDILVCLHDDTVEEGNGLFKHIPKFSKKFLLLLKVMAQTAPAGARTWAPKMYVRKLEDAQPRGSWSAGYTLPDGNIPTNTQVQYYGQVVDMATVGAVAEASNIIQITRVAPAAGTNLEGDLGIMCCGLELL